MRLRKRSTARSRGAATIVERVRPGPAGAGPRRRARTGFGGEPAGRRGRRVHGLRASSSARRRPRRGAANFDTDLMSQEWRNLDAPDAAILSAALFLAWLFGGYVAGRMARRAGLSHGFYTWALGAVLLVGAVAGLDQMTQSDALPTALRTLGVPTVFDEWRDLPALVGLAWALTALGGACSAARGVSAGTPSSSSGRPTPPSARARRRGWRPATA